MKHKAAFFDRDGTLIKDVSYLSSLDQIEWIPGIVDFCQFLRDKEYKIFIVTNQSGVARGFFNEAFVQQTHDFLHKYLQDRDVIVQASYYCPHHPTAAKVLKYKKDCVCRKPKPGMLLQVAQDFNIDLSKSLMFGDRQLDFEAGNAAGCTSFDINKVLSSSWKSAGIEKITV